MCRAKSTNLNEKEIRNFINEDKQMIMSILERVNGKVYAFMTWPDENARGKRAELLHKGTLTILDQCISKRINQY